MIKQITCRISGFGGQGVMLAGVVMGWAAILDGKYATHTQSYGPEARGGAARSDLVISDDEIDSLLVTNPNIVVAFSQEAYNKYIKGKAYDYAFIDSSIVQVDINESPNKILIPVTKLAVEELGSKLIANMIMLGIINGVTKIVSVEALREAVKKSVPERTIELNLKALDYGLFIVNKINKSPYSTVQ